MPGGVYPMPPNLACEFTFCIKFLGYDFIINLILSISGCPVPVQMGPFPMGMPPQHQQQQMVFHPVHG
jgi:hypothetical protein